MTAMGGQGQGFEATIDKERCLGAALTIGTKIASKFSGSGFSYWHFDANAGCGHNRTCEVPGSPVVFHTVADACLNGMQRRAFFCDHNQVMLDELATRLPLNWKSSSYLLPGDNEDGLEVFSECIQNSGERSSYAIGSVIVDPNGYWYRNGTGEGPPVVGLLRFAAKFPRVDIILNLNVGAYWRQRGAGQHVLPPRDVLASLNKANWLVRYTAHGQNRWLLAVGRNIETGDHRKLGFHKLDSIEGHAVMLKAERGRQGDLLDPSV
jgi:hypothetical protein